MLGRCCLLFCSRPAVRRCSCSPAPRLVSCRLCHRPAGARVPRHDQSRCPKPAAVRTAAPATRDGLLLRSRSRGPQPGSGVLRRRSRRPGLAHDSAGLAAVVVARITERFRPARGPVHSHDRGIQLDFRGHNRGDSRWQRARRPCRPGRWPAGRLPRRWLGELGRRRSWRVVMEETASSSVMNSAGPSWW